MLREEIQAILGLKDRKSFRDRYLKPALEAGLIEMTLPDKPTSKVQRYRKKKFDVASAYYGFSNQFSLSGNENSTFL